MNKFTKLILALALSASAGVATAGTIAGEIIIKPTSIAQATPVDLSGAATDSEGVEFSCLGISTTCTSTSEGEVFYATGDFSVLIGDLVNFFDFTFDALTAGSTLWQITDAAGTGNIFTLEMNTVDILHNTMTSVDLAGTGEFTLTDASGAFIDNAFGNWTFQTSTSGTLYSFDSTAAPEPAITLLLATGLIGFGFARRMRKSA